MFFDYFLIEGRFTDMSLELRGITKSFGSLVANDSIDFLVGDGEIHAILGENGAGKSTLMNIVYGLTSSDSGKILVDGKELDIKTPADALAAGIGMVHQHFMLIPVFTVAENIVLGHEKTKRFGLLDLETAKEEIRRVSKEFKASRATQENKAHKAHKVRRETQGYKDYKAYRETQACKVYKEHKVCKVYKEHKQLFLLPLQHHQQVQ